MRQPINFTQTELDELAEKSTGLSDWLEEKAFSVATHVVIPPAVTAVGSILVIASIALVVDGAIPDSVCWSGCTL